MRRRRFAPLVESLESRLLLSRSGLFAVIDTPNDADDNDQLQNQTTSDEVADQRDRIVADNATSNDDILQSDDEQLEPSQNRDLQVDVVRNVADEEPVDDSSRTADDSLKSADEPQTVSNSTGRIVSKSVDGVTRVLIDDADRNDVPVVVDDPIVIRGVDQVKSDKVGDDRIVVDQIGDDGADLASDLDDGVSVVDGDDTDTDEDEPEDSRKTGDDEVDDDDGNTDGTVAISVDRVSETDDEPDGEVLQLTVTSERLPIGHSQSVANDTNGQVELAQSDNGATATESEADENSILTATNEENHESTELSNSELVVAPLFTAVVLRAVHRASTSSNRDVWRDSNFANGDGFGAPRREQRRRQRDRDFGIPTKLRKRSLPYAGPPPEDVEEEFRDKPSQLEHTNLVFITPLSDWTNSEYSSGTSRSEEASGLEASAGIVIVGAAVSSVVTGVAVSRTKSRRNRNRSRKAGNTTPLYTGPTIDQIR